MHRLLLTRYLLTALIVIGLIIILIGPIARMMNEGFDPPGPLHVSVYWQRASYVLMPLGAAIAVIAGVLLVIVDRPR